MEKKKDIALELLGKNVKERRKELNLSQEELAQQCGFDRTYISLIERGKRNITYLNLLRLSKTLKATICEITKT